MRGGGMEGDACRGKDCAAEEETKEEGEEVADVEVP
jgi:hypothetical protein